MLLLSTSDHVLYHNHIMLVAPMSEIRAGLPLRKERGGRGGPSIPKVGVVHLELPACILIRVVVAATKLSLNGSISIW